MERPNRLSRTRTASTSLMSNKVPELSDAAYAAAEEVSLTDLLSIEATRHWAISCLSNIVNNIHSDTEADSLTTQDRAILYSLHRVNSMINSDTRHKSFNKCKESHIRNRALQGEND